MSRTLKEKKAKYDDDLQVTEKDRHSEFKRNIKNIIKHPVKLRGKNDSQIELIRSIKDNEITICSGHAGSGKTYVALAHALLSLRQETSPYNRIYLVKSIKALEDEDLGYLPGDLLEKIKPVMWSYDINLNKLVSETITDKLYQEKCLIPAPLAYVRGASLDNCIIIADEMQNVSIKNARTLLTRIGSNSKMILLGDTNQIDLDRKRESSLKYLIDIFSDVDEIGTLHMNPKDKNVRNVLIETIEEKFTEFYENKENGKR